MSLPKISAHKAHELHQKGALLIDVREAVEYAREYIPGTQLHPLSVLKESAPQTDGAEIVVFLCQSGMRTGNAAGNLKLATDCEAYILDGGLSAWKGAGYPTEKNDKAPISLVRQVLISAGILILAGFILGLVLNPAFNLLSAAVGAGLLFAGSSGFCPMATLLAKMPWNSARPAGNPLE